MLRQKRKKCLIVGSAVADVILEVERLPLTGEDFFAQSSTMRLGGCACNAAGAMNYLGAAFTLFAPIGTGVYGAFVRDALREAGLESPVSASAENGYCLCLVETGGERTFICVKGAEYEFQAEWLNSLEVATYDSVYICGLELAAESGEVILEFLERHRELAVFFAPGAVIDRIDKDRMKRILALSPVIHLNEDEIKTFSRADAVADAAVVLGSMTGNTVIVTLGVQGALLHEVNIAQKGRGGTRVIAPVEGVRVVDTIGAGDSHIGTVIAMRQLDWSFEEAVKKANEISALVVGQKGGVLKLAL